MEKLKLCPFCGGSDIDIRTDDGGLSWYSFCNDCGVICGYSITKDDVMNAWNRRVPTIDPVKHGKWEDRYRDGDWHCTECGAIVEKNEQGNHNWYYCYHCGARMDGE